MLRGNGQSQPPRNNTRRFGHQMNEIFADTFDTFDHLTNLKITVTEESRNFAKTPIEPRIAQIKSYTIDYLQELLEGEMLANQRLKERVQLITKRNGDLERRLEFVGTNVEPLQKKAIDKAEQGIKTLIARVNAQEAQLITARDTEANNARDLRDANEVMQVMVTTLEETKNRNIAEIAQLKKDCAQKEGSLKQASTQNKALDKQLEGTKRSENDLRQRLNQLEESKRRLQDENCTLKRDLNQCKQDTTQLEQQATRNNDEHRRDLQTHRDELQHTWETFKIRLEDRHRQELAQYKQQIKNQQRILDDAKRDLSHARATIREYESTQKDFEHAVRDELQRTMMVRYRDMVSEIAPNRPIPPRTSLPPTRNLSSAFPAQSVSNNGARCDNPLNKHEFLKEYLTEALRKHNNRRSRLDP